MFKSVIIAVFLNRMHSDGRKTEDKICSI